MMHYLRDVLDCEVTMCQISATCSLDSPPYRNSSSTFCAAVPDVDNPYYGNNCRDPMLLDAPFAREHWLILFLWQASQHSTLLEKALVICPTFGSCIGTSGKFHVRTQCMSSNACVICEKLRHSSKQESSVNHSNYRGNQQHPRLQVCLQTLL